MKLKQITYAITHQCVLGTYTDMRAVIIVIPHLIGDKTEAQESQVISKSVLQTPLILKAVAISIMSSAL